METLEGQLVALYGCSAVLAHTFAPALSRTMAEFGMSTPIRRAAFLAQVGEESGRLRFTEELASGQAYEGRVDLGNTQPGDGARFKGRGLIQLTGRANYRAAGEALSLPLEAAPERVAQLPVAVDVAGWFWSRHGLNTLADQVLAARTPAERVAAFSAITRVINGGRAGEGMREALFSRACVVFGVPPVFAAPGGTTP